jgi:hypothetical protein
MFVITGRVKVASYPEFVKRAETGLGPILRRNAGFRGLYCIDCGGGVGIGTMVFESAADAAASRDETTQWVEKNLAPLYLEEPLLESGELILSVEPDAATAAAAGAATGAEARPH